MTRLSALEYDILMDLWHGEEPLFVLLRPEILTEYLVALSHLAELGLVAWNRWEIPREWRVGNLPLEELEQYVKAKERAGQGLNDPSEVPSVPEFEFELTEEGRELVQKRTQCPG